MKKIAAALLSLGLLASSYSAAIAAEPEVYYNGQPLTLHQPAIVQESRTLLGLRDLAEQMHVSVAWDDATRLATICDHGKTITLQPDLQRVLIDGEVQQIDVGPQIINDHIYLPVRYLFTLLDADVFYRSYEDGRTVVSVNGRDAASNYVTTTGRQTTVVRQVTENGVHPLVITHDGAIVELVSQDGHLNIYRTDPLLNRMEKQTESTVLQDTVTDVLNDNGQYYAVLAAVQQNTLLGDGYTPESPAILKEIFTPQGRFSFSGSNTTVRTFALENNEGFSTKTVKGHLLDISHSNQTIHNHSYTTNASGIYGFLTDGQLLCVGNVPGEGYKVTSCNTISNTMGSARVFFLGDTFYLLGADSTEDGKQEIFATTSTSDGVQTAYQSVSALSQNETYRYVRITDAVQDGGKAYLLLQTNHNQYLACYDLVQQTFTAEQLHRNYHGFVHGTDGWQLYDYDSDYYYFLAVSAR